MASPAAVQASAVPLCVDLDGTVLLTDMLWESLVQLLRQNPFYAFAVLAWWCRGRAYLKRQIAARVQVDVTHLPVCASFCEFLAREKQAGRHIILVTASDSHLAERLAAHLGLFSEVIGSDGKINLRGSTKADVLTRRFGEHGFDYAGNSSVDLPVWQQARQALIVNASTGTIARARATAQVNQVFESPPSIWRQWLRSLRLYQWVKNLIVFVPLLTAHKLAQLPLLFDASRAFIAFGLCASAVYLLNDLLDLEADRQHPIKRNRPLASGALALPFGLFSVPLLLVFAGVVALTLPPGFFVVLVTYLVLTTAYSWILKQTSLLDVFCLAALYTLRLIAGHEATAVKYSAWLLVFSMFTFLSLALLKRFVEVSSIRARGRPEVAGRGYTSGDLELVASLGSSSGYLAALVLALYVNSQDVLVLYSRPLLLLLVCPLLLFWISRMWLLAHRRQMDEDPILFALKDAPSYVVGLLTLLVLWLAARW